MMRARRALERPVSQRDRIADLQAANQRGRLLEVDAVSAADCSCCTPPRGHVCNQRGGRFFDASD
ncbi:hypothetical protein XHV734_1317 [Xanthomonas hortorum pv. vitians]|nr:hypothetical protein XHV734_1317 [Xanthomonas hortorum pv. vitians]